MAYSHEQAIHDEVNLLRLVRRLEKAVAIERDWDEAAATQKERVWLKALGTLQKVKHGHKLLRNMHQYDPEPTTEKSRQWDDIKAKLNRLELFMKEVQKRTEPPPRRPEPILPQIPIPAIQVPEEVSSVLHDPEQESVGQKEQVGDAGDTTDHTTSQHDIFSSPNTSTQPPSDLLSPVQSLLPATPTIAQQPRPSLVAASTAIKSASTDTLTARNQLQASSALHEELSTQLAQMATQLRRNAVHFSDSLAKDKAVVEETQEKLEGNFGVMVKERLRLRDFRGKSKSTTCLTISIVLAVLVLFMFMVSVIRLSGR